MRRLLRYVRACALTMAMPRVRIQGVMLRRRTAVKGDWTCFICHVEGKGGTKGFYLHYMREHV